MELSIGTRFGAPYGTQLGANRLLGHVSVDSWQRDPPDEHLVTLVHPALYGLPIATLSVVKKSFSACQKWTDSLLMEVGGLRNNLSRE